MRSIVLAAVLFAGCGGNVADEAMTRMRTSRDRICACKDSACVQQARDEFVAWATAHRDQVRSAKPSDAFREKFNKLEEESDACRRRIEQGPTEAPPP